MEQQCQVSKVSQEQNLSLDGPKLGHWQTEALVNSFSHSPFFKYLMVTCYELGIGGTVVNKTNSVHYSKLKTWWGRQTSTGNHNNVEEVMRIHRIEIWPGPEVWGPKKLIRRWKIMKTEIGPAYQIRAVHPLIHPVISTNICKGLRKMIKMNKPQLPVGLRVCMNKNTKSWPDEAGTPEVG